MKQAEFYHAVMSNDWLNFNTPELRKLQEFFAKNDVDKNIRTTEGYIIIEEDEVRSNPYTKYSGMDDKLLIGICFHVTPYLKKIKANKHFKNEEIYSGVHEWRYFRTFIHPFPANLEEIDDIAQKDYDIASAEFEECTAEKEIEDYYFMIHIGIKNKAKLAEITEYLKEQYNCDVDGNNEEDEITVNCEDEMGSEYEEEIREDIEEFLDNDMDEITED